MEHKKIFSRFLVGVNSLFSIRNSSYLVFLENFFNNKSTQSIEHLVDILSSTSNFNLPKQSFEQIPNDLPIDLSTIGIWIDPVDGTQQYINGTDGILDSDTGIVLDGLPTALVLIGCFDVTNGRAVIGVINRSFQEKIDDYR